MSPLKLDPAVTLPLNLTQIPYVKSKVTAHQLYWEFCTPSVWTSISDDSAAPLALTKYFSVPLSPPVPSSPVPPPLTSVGPGFCGCLTPTDKGWGGGGGLGATRIHVCAVGVLISKCWRYTGLSCFLSPTNPTTQKPLWSRGSRQLAVTRHVQHGRRGRDWGPRTLAYQCHIITVT